MAVIESRFIPSDLVYGAARKYEKHIIPVSYGVVLGDSPR